MPAIFWQTLRHPQFPALDTSAVRWVGYGGAPAPRGGTRDASKAFPTARLGPGYGLTESGGSVCSLPHEYAVSHAHTVGLAAPGAEFQLLDEDSGTARRGAAIRAPTVAVGGWRNDAATMDTFGSGGCVEASIDSGIDDDGLLSIINQIKDTVNTRAARTSTALKWSMPGRLARPSPKWPSSAYPIR